MKTIYSRCAYNLADIDECETGDYRCGHYTVCVNTVGSYNCICLEGFAARGAECEGKSQIGKSAES